MILALFLSGLALSTAAFVALCLTAPAAEAVPPAVDAAAGNPVEAGGGAPSPLPASGALTFDEHVDTALAIFDDDWALWTREVAR